MLIAVCKRVGTSSFSKALCNARPLIMVANIPILSPCTRSIPLLAPATPLKMFPPPITMATSTPKSTTFFISPAYSAKRTGSIPYWLSPISASPLNFRSILLYFILRENLLQIYHFCQCLKMSVVNKSKFVLGLGTSKLLFHFLQRRVLKKSTCLLFFQILRAHLRNRLQRFDPFFFWTSQKY